MYNLLTILLVSSIFGQFELKNNHPIYLTFTEIDYKENDKKLEISIKVFADDLEKVFRIQTQKIVEIGTDREHPNANSLIENYLKKHFKLKINNQNISYKYLGKQMGDENNLFEMYIFLEVDNVNVFEEIIVTNTMLIKEHSNQLNFIACFTNQGIEKVICRRGEISQIVKW